MRPWFKERLTTCLEEFQVLRTRYMLLSHIPVASLIAFAVIWTHSSEGHCQDQPFLLFRYIVVVSSHCTYCGNVVERVLVLFTIYKHCRGLVAPPVGVRSPTQPRKGKLLRVPYQKWMFTTKHRRS